MILGTSGVWTQDKDYHVRPLALEGKSAPGGPQGGVFGTFYSTQPVINDFGQVAFSGIVSDPASPFHLYRLGIWAQERSDELKLIALGGQQIDVDNGPGVDLRTINYVELLGSAGTEDGHGHGFNDRGDVAFLATFTDGSQGIFVSDAAAIAEPASVQLIMMGAIIPILLAKNGLTARVRRSLLLPCGEGNLYGARRGRRNVEGASWARQPAR